MAVAQLVGHGREHLEELLARHALGNSRKIAGTHLLPVEPILGSLVVEKTIALVERLPQGVEIAAARVGRNILGDAGRRHEEQHEGGQQALNGADGEDGAYVHNLS